MFDYKEVVKKNGQRLVFCNLEELLMGFYGVHTMEEVEPHVNTNGEYIIHCPFCAKEGHTKHKLYIKSDLSVGHCFVCTRAFIHVSEQVDTSFEVPDYISTFNIHRDKPDIVPLMDNDWTLDMYYSEFDDFSQKGYDYLVGRHKYMKDLYKILGFKFWNDNIVMPFIYHGKVFYYQIRFTGKKKKDGIRYYFPPISNKPPYIIEHGLQEGKRNKIIICEGVFDAIALLIMAPEFIPCAVLGSSISDYQMDFIREYVPEVIYIMMDSTDISERIASKVKTRIDYCPIRIIKSDGEDPEECMIRRIKRGLPLQWIKPPIGNNRIYFPKPKLNFGL